MDDSRNSSRLKFWWLGVAVLALAGLWLAVMRSPQSIRPRGLSVLVDTNGVPHMGGVPLANTNVRDAVFRMMGSAGFKVNASSSAGLSNASDVEFRKFIETISSMNRAGLLPTNSAPNPYE